MMILFKFSVAAAIVIIGYIYAKKYRNKAKFFGDLHIFLLSYCDCLQFSRSDLIQFVDGQKEHNEIFGEFLHSCKRHMKCPDEEIVFPDSIKIDEDWKVLVGQFFENLGKSDAAGELSKCGEYKQIFQKYKIETETESKRNFPLFFKLSIYGAILFLVLFL